MHTRRGPVKARTARRRDVGWESTMIHMGQHRNTHSTPRHAPRLSHTMMDPLRFTPFLRPMVWGGRRLGQCLGKLLPDQQLYGESWEISDHAAHASVVDCGPLVGLSLCELMTRYRVELLGAAAKECSVFPWLVKHLDAHDWLSVQVHPDDNLVQRWWPGEGGKTEVWFVLEALAGSKIYAGLLPDVDESALRQALQRGAVTECLHSFEPHPGDCVYLPAGTVHAVGGGVLMVEVQQTSDATFRLFDWNRRDAAGNARALHIDQSMACIDWRAGPVQPVQAPGFDRGCQTPVRQMLAQCRYFHLAFWRDTRQFAVDGQGKLQLLIVVQGQGSLLLGQAEQALAPGQVWVLPATAPEAVCQPEAALSCLICTLPD
jgi:mannose-6-phosphate isomerase